MRLFLILLLFTTLVFQVHCQGSRCTTPDDKIGICKNIRSCQPLLDLLLSQSNNQQVREFLRRSQCGVDGRDPLVCCPGAAPQPSTPSTSTSKPPVNSNSNGVASEKLPSQCGYSEIPHTKIVGGSDAKLYAWPWVVLLGYRSSTPSIPSPVWRCGASLITDRHLLTAAHCVYNRRDLYLARLGELDLDSDNDGASPIDVRLSRALVHPEYNNQRYTTDIALLWLERPVTFSDFIKPVCLPTTDLKNKDLAYTLAFIAGWGAVEFNGTSSSILQEVQLPITTEKRCQDAYSKFQTAVIDQRVLCAGYQMGGKDACQGDSGGPMMSAFKRYTYTQIGVVSFGFKCAEPGIPGVYTRVTHFLDWILNNI